MKILVILSLFFFAVVAKGGEYNCKLNKDFKQIHTLPQVAFSEDDPEEESESYEYTLSDGVRARVDYLPYQDGLYLLLEDRAKGVQATTNFDQPTDEFASLELNLDKQRYILSCRKN